MIVNTVDGCGFVSISDTCMYTVCPANLVVSFMMISMRLMTRYLRISLAAPGPALNQHYLHTTLLLVSPVLDQAYTQG